MDEPTAALDKRFSDPAAHPVSWQDARRLLETAEISWISTVRADGRPHVTPLVTAWADDVLFFTTGSREQKYVNLLANPHVVLTTGANDWDHGIDVVVEGKAVQVTDEAVLTRAAAAFAAKWDGQWQYEVHDGRFRSRDTGWPCEVFGVAPVKAFAHSKGTPFGATTYRF